MWVPKWIVRVTDLIMLNISNTYGVFKTIKRWFNFWKTYECKG